MKTKLKDLSDKDKAAMIQGARMAHSSPVRDAFWDEVDRLLNASEAKKAPKVVGRNLRD